MIELKGPPEALGRALMLVSRGTWKDAGYTRSLDPRRILADAWHPGRLRQARERLAAGEQAPPITVVGYRLGSQVWYEPSDGIHRTVAAREAGRKIRAKVSGYYYPEPSRYVLWQRNGERWELWREMTEPKGGLEHIWDDIGDEVIDVLRRGLRIKCV